MYFLNTIALNIYFLNICDLCAMGTLCPVKLILPYLIENEKNYCLVLGHMVVWKSFASINKFSKYY